MKKNPNIIICGNYGATNLGDEAILKSILQTVHQVVPAAQVKVVSSNPQETIRLYNVESIPMIPSGIRSFFGSIFNKSWTRSFKNFRECDVVLFGGGGLFTDEKPRAILIWFMQIFPAIWYKKNIFCFGQSVGPLKHSMSRAMVKYVFKRIKIITVRDVASQKLLKEIGVGGGAAADGIQVLPDPVFGLKKAHTPTDLDKKSNNEAPEDFVVFSIRPWMKTSQNFTQIFADFIDWIFEKHHLKSVLVPFQNVHDDDTKIMLQIFSHVKNKDAANVWTYEENIQNTLNLMKNARAIIGMRLHSLIFSTLEHTPFLGLSYSQKVTEVVNQLGMENYLVNVADLDLKNLQEKFDALILHEENIKKNLTEKHQKFSDETKKYGEFLKNLLNE